VVQNPGKGNRKQTQFGKKNDSKEAQGGPRQGKFLAKMPPGQADQRQGVPLPRKGKNADEG